LAAGEIHVWAISLADSSIDAIVLSPAERERAARFAFDKPRRTFVVTRIALRSLLGRYLNAPPQEVSIESGLNGKPRLAAGDLQFNVAHSSDLALIAITCDGEIGVDLEELRPVGESLEIAESNFHPNELAAIRRACEADVDREFLRCWTRKEAIVKALGVGIGYPLDTFDALGSQSSDEVVDMISHGDLASCRCRVREIDPSSDYVAALATLAEGQSLLGFTYSP
jgi:4'-phosphopantetheinyl transferase